MKTQKRLKKEIKKIFVQFGKITKRNKSNQKMINNLKAKFILTSVAIVTAKQVIITLF